MSPPTERRRWPVRALLLAGAAILGLVGAEFFVRALITVRDVGPSLTEYDPVLGSRLKPDFHCVRESPEFEMSFSSNSLGWRGPEPTGSRAEILFLGDSFTMGYGVDDGREFPQLLSDKLSVPVVNTGLGGTGPERWPRLLRGQLRRFHPRLIVLQLSSNDLKDVLQQDLASLDARGALVDHDPPPPSAGRRVQKVLEMLPWIGESHLMGLCRQLRVRGSGSDPAVRAAEDREGLALARALLVESIRIGSEQGCRVVVLSANMTAAEAAPFVASCEDEGTPFVRMPSKVEAPELYYVVDGHWNEAGHRRAAELLEPWLR